MALGWQSSYRRWGRFPNAVAGQGGNAPGSGPDIALSALTVTTDWERVVVGTLSPVNIAEPVYFEIVEDANGPPGGFGVENG